MTASAENETARQGTRSRGRRPGSPVGHSEAGAATRLRIRGLSALAQTAAPEKEKVSITLDKSLVDEIRSQFGGRALSTSINELLYVALAQAHLAELVDEMEQEAGPASPEAYDRVLAQWFDES
jgi:hypothetical protein